MSSIIKDKLKKNLLKKLHAIDTQEFDVVHAVITRGIKGFICLDYEKLKNDILQYISTVQVGPYSYKYSKSRNEPCLYASVYAVMIEGLFGVLNDRADKDKRSWADYINSFQSPDDGLYYDPVLDGTTFEHIGIWGEGWGKHHLIGHVIIALARLGHTPKYPLKYLEKYYDEKYLISWLYKFDLNKDVWSESNYVMNLYTVLQYARDYMSETRAVRSVEIIADWLLKKQNPETGMWHKAPFNSLDHFGKLNVVRGAYHFYPLFVYDNITIPYCDKIVESILPLQNSYGGWTLENGNSGACEDIDAVEPLIRCALIANCPRKEIETAIKRSMVWQLSCRNNDGGFSFYLRAQQEYGGHPVTTSIRDESSMFATWFRSLCLAYEMNYLGIPNGFSVGRFPGYEISLFKKI